MVVIDGAVELFGRDSSGNLVTLLLNADGTLSGATPDAHAASHAPAGSDPLTLVPAHLHAGVAGDGGQLVISSANVTFHGCSAYHNAVQTGSAGVRSLNSEDFDTDGYHDNATNNSRITIPAGLGGYYLVRGFVYTGASPDGSTPILVRIQHNGLDTVRGTNTYQANVGGSTEWIGLLEAGDYVEIYTDTIGNTGHASAPAAQNALSVALLGTV